MVHDKYDLLDTNDSTSGVALRVWLYANNQTVDDNHIHETSPIVSAIVDACEQLENHNALDMWAVFRFKGGEHNYPNFALDGAGVPSNKFGNFISDGSKNGTGSDLSTYMGAHMFVHNQHECTTSWSGGGSGQYFDIAEYSDECRQDLETTALERARLAWIKATCSDQGKAKNAAIQEPLHQVIMQYHPEVTQLTGGQTDDEHVLGMVDDGPEYDTTPMLTFHADEYGSLGQCQKLDSFADDYKQDLTQCTKDAVKVMKEDADCNDPV